MKRPGDHPLVQLQSSPAATRPGRVAAIRGVIFQSDAKSLIGSLFIRPLETFDQWQAGLARRRGEEPLAMHAGLHVDLEDGREYVAEQLVGTIFEDFEDGLNWTPVERFRERDNAGWDATVPLNCFRGIDDSIAPEVVEYLNTVEGRPFLSEDCVGFVERACGGRRLFGDSPTAMTLGFGARVADPALPLLRSDAPLDARAARRLRLEAVCRQPDPKAPFDAPNAHLWLGRFLVWSVIGLLIAGLWGLSRRKR